MSRDELIRLIIYTMKYYGSDAGEAAQSGSKLRSQAEHIADVIHEYNDAVTLVGHMENVGIVLLYHKL